MGNPRAERVGRQILQEVSNLVEFELNDPRLELATFTDVEMTPDLKIARIRFSKIGNDEDRVVCGEGLKRAAGFLRREIGRRLRLKYVPELRFEIDRSLDLADNIAKLTASTPEDGHD
jgi:ribosome-binding factor A